MSFFRDMTYNTGFVAQSLWDTSSRFFYPNLRLGVTGLSRSGKTVFTTAFLHNLMNKSHLPAFHAISKNVIRNVQLMPQPNVTSPRFLFEDNIEKLVRRRQWPSSTDRISEIRLGIDYEKESSWLGAGQAHLTLDIVDYPGEWILDLALFHEDFRSWSMKVLDSARMPARQNLSKDWLGALSSIDPHAPLEEGKAHQLAHVFKDYLRSLRASDESVATTPPGRFLMPGDLESSPALTFFPMDLKGLDHLPDGSFAKAMQQRFEAYKEYIVKPFFRNHFQRIDRQIVLVDVLSALDSGPTALAELETALDNVLLAFNIGRNSFLSHIFSPRTEKILFVATKADHLHHENHNKLNAILRFLVSRSLKRCEVLGAEYGTLALASIRATQEKTVKDHGEILKAISGVPEAGEYVGEHRFDGKEETILFPGDLPEDPENILKGVIPAGSLRFPRFRPPEFPPDIPLNNVILPHIRLDRALEFLMGDYLV